MTYKDYLQALELLTAYNYEYYSLDQPSVSDEAYDALRRDVLDFEKKHPGRVAEHSPTNKIGGQLSEKFVKRKHSRVVGSLNDAFNLEEAKDFYDKTCQQLERPSVDLVIDPKIDGLALVATYRDGRLQRAVTRGDGYFGEDVTVNAKTIRNLPLKLPGSRSRFHKGEVEIRGEVVIYKQDFLKLNRAQARKKQKTYANARNTAAGTLRQLDPRLVAARKLVFRGYDIVDDSIKSQTEAFKIMADLKITTNPDPEVCRSFDELKQAIADWQTKRQELAYGTDGLVIRVNDRELFRRLGSVGRAPKGALAFKFSPEKAVTSLKDIRLQIGRTGSVTPVAILAPVKLAGTTVRKASLHNATEIERLRLAINDQVVVVKSGDIIPKVIAVSKPGGGAKFDFRKALKKHFPNSRFRLTDSKLSYTIAETSDRTAQDILALRIKHYAARSAVDIQGLGPANVRALIEAGLVGSLDDIYRLNYSELVKLERFADKSSRNLLAAIEARKKPDLAKFIIGLGITHVGEQTALDLAAHFRSLAKLRQAKADDFIGLEGVGPITGQAIYGWLQDKPNKDLLSRLAGLGVKPVGPALSSNKLAGWRIVITGNLAPLFQSRQQAQNRISQLGGSFGSQVGKTTDYLVVGDKPGQAKLQQARKHGVKTLSPAEFKRLMNS